MELREGGKQTGGGKDGMSPSWGPASNRDQESFQLGLQETITRGSRPISNQGGKRPSLQ